MKTKYLNLLRWRKSFLAILLGGMLFLWFAFFDTYSLWTRFQLNQRMDELQTKKTELQQKSLILKDKIEDLETDPDLLERIAREKYGMKREGETVYKIKEVE